MKFENYQIGIHHSRWCFGLIIILKAMFVTVIPVIAQEELTEEQKLELAKKLQNPVANVQTLPFQNNFDFGFGPDRKMKYTLNIQPAFPSKLKNGAMFILRPVVPVISSPSPEPYKAFGLGDVSLAALYVPKPKKPSFLAGGGLQLNIPTATDDVLGFGKWAMGPSIVLVKMSKKIVAGTLISNMWSFAGNADRGDVNFMLWQVFLNYNLKNGLSISYSPNITANWNAKSKDVWTFPLGLGLTKMIPLKGGKAMTLIGQYYYNVVRPDIGPEQSFRFQINYAIPKG